jgi:uncharacterized damage-inducible protein DinB
MNAESKQLLTLKPVADCPPEIGIWLGALEDARQRTRKALQGINPAAVDWISGHHDHTIGTVLYHIAIVEMDWLAVEVMEGKLPKSVWDDFVYDMRDSQGKLTTVVGVSLSEHWRRLDAVREQLLAIYKVMLLEDFRRSRVLDAYDVTPEWVLHHLCQHEAEHRPELASIRAAFEKTA